jgi:alpha-ketoglutarate-dependent 2,4-dichlorophenoxyacetate dioxygenase
VTIAIRPLHPLFAGEVSGVDLRAPLAPAAVAAIHDGMNRHGILIFHAGASQAAVLETAGEK